VNGEEALPRAAGPQPRPGAPGIAAGPCRVVSVDVIRHQFPGLTRRCNGRSVAYFDGPGGTQVPTSVAAAMADYLLRHNANTRWAYTTSRETDEAIDSARRALADLVGGSPDEMSSAPT